jgi:hypothetical protein
MYRNFRMPTALREEANYQHIYQALPYTPSEFEPMLPADPKLMLEGYCPSV